MVKSNPGYLGISEPISLSGPTEKDVIQTAEVEKFLADAGLYESQEEAVSREEVLGKLDRTVKTWIKKATRVSGYGDQFVQQANAKIFTFGSYRLGVLCYAISGVVLMSKEILVSCYSVFMLFAYFVLPCSKLLRQLIPDGVVCFFY
uniref:Poly(A) polymerase nucleotidyltransferase domain-containing protein n=1 Tax=Aegilops tauschii subsp. strangulata TaxID=200361 RepID=A0A453JZ62_AEGTS